MTHALHGCFCLFHKPYYTDLKPSVAISPSPQKEKFLRCVAPITSEKCVSHRAAVGKSLGCVWGDHRPENTTCTQHTERYIRAGPGRRGGGAPREHAPCTWRRRRRSSRARRARRPRTRAATAARPPRTSDSCSRTPSPYCQFNSLTVTNTLVIVDRKYSSSNFD